MLATFGSHGDVHPFVGLGLALKRRGHDVTLHTSEYFGPLARSVGLAFSALGTAEEFKQQLNDPQLWHRTKGYKAVFGIGVKSTLRRSYDVLKTIVRPDTILVSSSLALAGRVLHDELGCPGATVHLSPATLRSCIQPPKMAGLFMPAWYPMWLKQKIWATGDRYFIDPLICPSINELRKEIGLPPVSRILNSWWNHPELVIGFWPDWYASPPGDWPVQTKLVGFPLYDEADVSGLSDELKQFLAAGDKPIAFTPGTAMKFGAKFFAAAVDACSQLGKRGLLMTRHAEQIPASLPPTVLHVPYAPFSTLLPHCAAFVHHGGIGSTAQALKAGIPQVVTHFSHDQPDNAERLKRLGVGVGLDARKISGKRLAGLLGPMLSDPHVARACQGAARLVNTDGLDRAAALLEQLPANARTAAVS